MSVAKNPAGNWRVKVKHKGELVFDRTFPTKRQAEHEEAQAKLALSTGDYIDSRAGRKSLGECREDYLMARKGTVASTTYANDVSLLNRHIPELMAHKPVNSIRTPDLEKLFGNMLRDGLSRGSVVRFRAALSTLFDSVLKSRAIGKNPVTAAKVPKGLGEDDKASVFPFTIAELRSVVADLAAINVGASEVVHVLGLSGLRWGEMTPLRVRDVITAPNGRLVFAVSQSAPDNHPVRSTTKGGRTRTVPVAIELEPIILRRTLGRDPDDLLFTSPEGNWLNRSNFVRDMKWAKTGRGRRLHDLRHTAATLWLTNGLDPKVVQRWLGHASLTLTLDLYGHWMGTDADTAAMAKFDLVLGT